MSLHRNDVDALFQISAQGSLHFFPEIYDVFIAAFSAYLDRQIIKINIFQIEPDAF